MRIAEIYQSIQGEGVLTGTKSVFVRVSGCNLRCWYCDTPYASWYPEGEDLSVDEILREVDRLACEHVVLTGGEPMLFAELIPLCDGLRSQKRHITIETAGTLHLPLECDLMSISPKLANSTPGDDLAPKWRERHDRSRYVPEVICRLTADYDYQFKFVVGDTEHCDEALDYLKAFPAVDRSRVMLMPLGETQEEMASAGEWLPTFCREHGIQYCPRKQIEWFGAVRGT